MLLPHHAVIAVVDGEELQLYLNSGNEAAPVLSPMKSPKLDQHNRDSGARHISSSANPSESQLEEDSHAAAVASWLNEQARAQKIRSLVVIAAPRTLGEMRRRYDKALISVLVGEVPKELIGRDPLQILEALHLH